MAKRKNNFSDDESISSKRPFGIDDDVGTTGSSSSVVIKTPDSPMDTESIEELNSTVAANGKYFALVVKWCCPLLSALEDNLQSLSVLANC